jgi:hypothetical protein
MALWSTWRVLAAVPLALVSLAACADIGPTDPGTVDAGDGPQDGDGDGDLDPDAAPAEQCVAGTFQLLDNPNFDEGPVDWVEMMGPIIFPDEQIPITPHSGSRAAWLGRTAAADQKLSQAIELPLGTTALRFTGQTCLVTGEDPVNGALDAVTVSVLATGGAPIAELVAYSNLDAGSVCNWASFDIALAQDYTPQPAVLQLHAVSAAGGLTSFYFDTLSLVATTDCP